MKKAILLVIIVMVAAPCFAEVEPDGFFSVDGTLWGVCNIEFISNKSPFFYMNCDNELSFYQRMVFFNQGGNWTQLSYPSYVDLPVISVAYDINPLHYFLAIMQPAIGLGVLSWVEYHPGGCNRGGCTNSSLEYRMGIMFKKTGVF